MQFFWEVNSLRSTLYQSDWPPDLERCVLEQPEVPWGIFFRLPNRSWDIPCLPLFAVAIGNFAGIIQYNSRTSCMGWIWTQVFTHHKTWAPFLVINSKLGHQHETRHSEKHGPCNTLLSYPRCWFWFSDKVNWLSQGKFAPHLLWTEQAQPALINHSHQETGTNSACSAGASSWTWWHWYNPRVWDCGMCKWPGGTTSQSYTKTLYFLSLKYISWAFLINFVSLSVIQ